MPTLTEVLKSINYEKDEELINEYNQSDYVPFIVNRGLSFYSDTVLLANDMNVCSHLPKNIQYKYYLKSVTKKKRFAPWLKSKTSKNLNNIKEYYGVSIKKAKTILPLLSADDLKIIEKKLDKGGKNE